MTDTSADGMAALAGEAPPKKGGMLSTVLAIVVLTAVAAGGGSVVGSMIGGKAEAPQPAPTTAPAAKTEAGSELAAGKNAGDPVKLVALQPVITNVYAPAKTRLRLQASIVIRGKEVKEPEVLAAQVEADTLAFLRTVQLAQIEGARGLLHLHEDLKERAILRSPAIVDYIIQSLVAE